jgi:aromatic ring-opening dioxygenase catalytic subunit (LigB family)
MPRGAIVSLSHGAGPLPILQHPSQKNLVNSMKTKAANILRLNTPDAPRAIILITAHWEEDVPTISGGANPPLLYDYYGFPPEAYDIKYPAPGSPEIAQEIHSVLEKAGLNPKMDTKRGNSAS